MKTWHLLGAEQALEALETRRTGLGESDAASRLNKYGYNEIKEDRRTATLQVVFRQFKNLLILLLLAAALVSSFIGLWEHGVPEMAEAALIILIVLLMVYAGFYQEYHAEKDLAALKRMLDPMAVVERSSRKRKISARELVPGDIIHLEAGCRVPADCRIIEAVQLKIDESVLTGEADSVTKGAGALEGDARVGDRSNMARMGTTVTYGKGVALVVETGMRTSFGRIAGRIQEIEDENTPASKTP